MKNRKLNGSMIIFAAALMVIAAVNQGAARAQANSESFAVTDFFMDGASARVFGMGNAFSGLADDVSAAYWNPAGLYYLRGNEFTSTRSSRSVFDLDTTTQTLGFALPLENSTVGFNLVYSTLGNAIITDRDEATGRLVPSSVIDSDEFAFSLSYAAPLRWREGMSFGATLKSVKQKVANFSASGIGFDLGALYTTGEHRRYGLVFQNVADMDVGTDVIPFNVRLGASDRFMDGKLLVSAQYDTDYLNDTVFAVGAEYDLAENFAARIGSNDGELAAGVGINYENFVVDYAFNNDDEAGNLSKISISYLTGSSRRKPQPDRVLKKKEEPAKEVKKPSRAPRPEPSRRRVEEEPEKDKKETARPARKKPARETTTREKPSRQQKRKTVKTESAPDEEDTADVQTLKKNSEISAPETESALPWEISGDQEQEAEEETEESEESEEMQYVIPEEEEPGTFTLPDKPLDHYRGSIPAYEEADEPDEGEAEFQIDPY